LGVIFFCPQCIYKLILQNLLVFLFSLVLEDPWVCVFSSKSLLLSGRTENIM